MDKDLVLLNCHRPGKKVVKLYVDDYDEDWLALREFMESKGFTFRRPHR